MSQKTIVITGASRGLGAGMAKTFAALGHRLGLCSRTEPILPCSSEIHSQTLNVTDFQELDDFIQATHAKLGPIDLWINNAGLLGPIGPLREVDHRSIKQHMDTNVLGLIYGSQLYVRHLHDQNHQGALINISSGAARGGYFGWTSYCASKAAVDNFTQALALEEKDRLRAYSVAPGVIDTDMQEQIRNSTEEQFPMVDKFHKLKKANTFNTPEFVAHELLKLVHSQNPTTDVCLRLPNEYS